MESFDQTLVGSQDKAIINSTINDKERFNSEGLVDLN